MGDGTEELKVVGGGLDNARDLDDGQLVSRAEADGPQPEALAAFLRDVTELVTKQQTTVEAQTRDGFVAWCDDVSELDGVQSPLVERPEEPAWTVLDVRPPGPQPQRPEPNEDGEVDPDAQAAYRQERNRWEDHKQLYDDLFAARTPPDGMELVVGRCLLAARSDRDQLRRHLVVAPAEVDLDRGTRHLRVTTSDAPRHEINWTMGSIRQRLVEDDECLRELVEAQSIAEIDSAIDRLRASFGTSGTTLDFPDEPVGEGGVAVGTHAAVLLRRKDSSALLDLLRTMADDMAGGGVVSEPFRMLLTPAYVPAERAVRNDRAALPLPANTEQREMIDRARHETHMVVQGPPGTGKTHTIANLASVLMAEGRRVLITAENERALTEVQSKLPKSMQPLLLPMLREEGGGALQGSVNALNTAAGSAPSAAEAERRLSAALERLEAVEQAISDTERELIRIADADRAERTFGDRTMRLDGHLRHLAAQADELSLVDRLLEPDGRLGDNDAHELIRLSDVVTEDHEFLRQFSLPEGLLDPGDFAVWLQEHRSGLAALGDPVELDHAHLVEAIDELGRLSQLLQEQPPTPWVEVDLTPEDYTAAADECASVAPDVDHGVSVSPLSDRNASIALLEAYLELDPKRFDAPLDSLREQYAQAEAHIATASIVGDFSEHRRARELISSAEDAANLIRRDLSGLLEQMVADHRGQGRSRVDALVREAGELQEGARAPLGLPVAVSDDAPATHELLRQAEILRDHLAEGGKLKRKVGTPRAVKDAADLIAHVQVGGSEVDTLEEAERTVAYFAHRKTIELIDAWASSHDLDRPSHVNHHEWLEAITLLPDAAAKVTSALELVDELVNFPHGTGPESVPSILDAALATVSAEVATSLGALVAAAADAGEVRLDGRSVLSHEDAQRAVAALRALNHRERCHARLPKSWRERCNPAETDADPLERMLRVCAAAAAVPGRARTADLTPSAVNRIVDRAQTDERRRQLLVEHDDVVGGMSRAVAACVPASPATQAIGRALEAESPTDYRHAIDQLERERVMATDAAALALLRERAEGAHPRLLLEFESGREEARLVLADVEAYQRLRDHRTAVRGWQEEVGSTKSVHERLEKLHIEARRAEEKLADLRCWTTAVERLRSRRELKSALSALTIAMDKVPKTRTAKSYPARMRALRTATLHAAPAIPCWVMSVDRVAEVLGYPTGEERFDVVIVDEASQAWFPSTFIYAIADQVIVVGDDLQTSPSVPIGEDGIRSMVNEHIRGHRLADQVGDDLSLYDVAAVMTGPDTMVDHFRCVPEIIDISNRLSYEPKGKRLLPSRVREPGALEPVVHLPVAGIRQRKTSANLPEVEAIVDAVVNCHADSSYDDMDFGVVVVGTSPAAHLKALRTRLLEELGPTAIEERRLEIGTSAQFQGAERNVMFLSLIDVPPEPGALRKWPHEHTGRNRRRVQQLNVAVSRARDQLWIVRSFERGHLAPGDARSVLLHDPKPDVASLEEELERCDSDFERHVVQALSAADPTLRIRTQVEAIGYSIDIVVEDRQGHRVAVECDGDRWHISEDRIRADLYRQRTLESIGWRFVRFLASEWYDDPDHYVAEIRRELTSGQAAQTSHRVRRASSPVVEVPSEPDESEWEDEPYEDDDPPRETSSGDEWPTNSPAPSNEAAHLQEELFESSISAAGSNSSVGAAPSVTQRESPREQNRRLAAALRAAGVPRNGLPWNRAKALVEEGLTYDEAAARIAGESRTRSGQQTHERLTCQNCGETWSRRLVRGRKPSSCPDCR